MKSSSILSSSRQLPCSLVKFLERISSVNTFEREIVKQYNNLRCVLRIIRSQYGAEQNIHNKQVNVPNSGRLIKIQLVSKFRLLAAKKCLHVYYVHVFYTRRSNTVRGTNYLNRNLNTTVRSKSVDGDGIKTEYNASVIHVYSVYDPTRRRSRSLLYAYTHDG